MAEDRRVLRVPLALPDLLDFKETQDPLVPLVLQAALALPG